MTISWLSLLYQYITLILLLHFPFTKLLDNPEVSTDMQHRHHIYHTAIVTEFPRRQWFIPQFLYTFFRSKIPYDAGTFVGAHF